MKTNNTDAYVNALQLLNSGFCQWFLKADFCVTIYWKIHQLHSSSVVHSCKYCLDFLGSGDSLPVCCSTYQLIGITNELSDFLIATARKPPRVTADGFLIGSHFKTNFSDLLSVNNVIKAWRFQISPITLSCSSTVENFILDSQ